MSIANYLTALDAQRDQLARNLVAMGVQASESEKLNTLVPKVLQIPTSRPETTLFHSAVMRFRPTVSCSTPIMWTATAAFPVLRIFTRISAALKTTMRSTTTSRTSTGAQPFTPCVSLRCASRLRRRSCSATIPAARTLARCGWYARRRSSFLLRRLQDTFTKRSAAERRSPFRSAGSARSVTSSPSCTIAAVYLLTTIISRGSQ